MPGYRGYLPMLAGWPAAAPLIADLRQQAGLRVDSSADSHATHALLYRADGEPVAYARLHPDGAVDSLCLRPGASVADAGPVLVGYVAEQALAQSIPRMQITPPDGWRHLLQKLDSQAAHDHHLLVLDTATVGRHWRLAGLDEAILGETPIRWEIAKPEEYAAVIVQMARQARRSLRIFSPALEHALFDNAHLAEAVSALARRSRYTDVRLLVQDPRPLVQRGHVLLTLHRRLPSTVPLLKLQYKTDEIKDTLVLIDGCGIVCKPERDDDSGYACFSHRPEASALTERFDHLWQRAVSDTEIRGLAI